MVEKRYKKWLRRDTKNGQSENKLSLFMEDIASISFTMKVFVMWSINLNFILAMSLLDFNVCLEIAFSEKLCHGEFEEIIVGK